MKIMASGAITSWQIDGETMETVLDFILGGSKITADGDCIHEIKRHLLLGRKVMTNLVSILKGRDTTFTDKGPSSQRYGFSSSHVWMWESWAIKQAECRRTDASELWWWSRLLRVPWTARRSNQSFLKEISPGCSLEGLVLKLKLLYFGHLMGRADSFEKTLMLGEIEDRRRRGQQRMRLLDGITDVRTWVWASSRSWWWKGKSGMLQCMVLQKVGHDWVTELNWLDAHPGWFANTSSQDATKVFSLSNLFLFSYCLFWYY